MQLYHGSDVVVERPRIELNAGYADLGQGFYVTDDYEAACRRAASRARRTGAAGGVVSVFELDEDCVPWASWGAVAPVLGDGQGEAFGLRFEPTAEGLAAWMRYIMTCRAGRTAVDGLGDPSIVRGWIATEEVEMACSGFASPEELAGLMDAGELIAQWCVRNQKLADDALHFVRAEQP